MKKNMKTSSLAALFTLLLMALPASAQSVDFRGFQMDMTRLTPQQKQKLTPSYLEQIRIIEAANLPTEMLEFFKTVPIIVDPTFVRTTTSAIYRRTKDDPKGEVVVDLTPIDPAKPVLLHEMLHAYDANFWNFKNQVVVGAYNRAKSERLYSEKVEKSHFLENAREFFAIAGTIYLVGTIKQEPYDCKVIAAQQPIFVQFLERTFGPKPHCRLS
jgi:hypothetical protein